MAEDLIMSRVGGDEAQRLRSIADRLESPLTRALQIFGNYVESDGGWIACSIESDGLRIECDPEFMSDEHFEELKSIGFSQEHNYFLYDPIIPPIEEPKG